MEIKKIECPSCGAPLRCGKNDDICTCEYCNSTFTIEGNALEDISSKEKESNGKKSFRSLATKFTVPAVFLITGAVVVTVGLHSILNMVNATKSSNKDISEPQFEYQVEAPAEKRVPITYNHTYYQTKDPKEKLQKGITYSNNDYNELTDDERAAIIAKFYEKSGAYREDSDSDYEQDSYGLYTTEDISRYIEVMNGELKCDDDSEIDTQKDELYRFYIAMLNSEKYKRKINAYCRAQKGDRSSDLPVWNYYLDLTDTILPSQDYNAFVVVDYLDDLHKRILSSASKEEAMNLTYSYYQCLASLLYGKGFDINGDSYTREDFNGIENLGLRSVLELATLEVAPYSAYIGKVPYINKDGDIAYIDSQTITIQFTAASGGTYNGDYSDDLGNSMRL